MPEPNKDEEHDDFIKRCIPVVIDDGTAESPEQAVAICNGIWDKAKEGKNIPPEDDTSKHKSSKIMEFGIPFQIMEFKSEGDEWRVDGYASTFGNPDDGDDIVAPGSFTRTLSIRPKPAFLKSHDMSLILGKPKLLKQDNKGLFGQHKISKTTLGEDTRQLVIDGVLDSFSIGYRAADFEYVEDGKYRLLKDIDLYEISLVSVPMNTAAIVTGVKENITLADKTNKVNGELSQLLNELRGLVDKDHPLTKNKQQEIIELLDTLSGMDAVRSDLQSILTAQPSSLVESHRLKFELAQFRKRHPELI